MREQTRHVQRLERTLEEANINPGFNPGDLMGVSARRIIEAMIPTGQARGLKARGERNPQRLAALAERTVKASPKALYHALHGRLRDQHRFLLKLHLQQWDAIDTAIRQIDRRVAEQIESMDAGAADQQPPFRELIARLCAIPGVGPLSATAILAEIGRDMSRFPTAGHLPDRRSFDRLGRAVSRPERKCGQAKIFAPAPWRSLADDHVGAMCLGRQAREKQLL